MRDHGAEGMGLSTRETFSLHALADRLVSGAKSADVGADLPTMNGIISVAADVRQLLFPGILCPSRPRSTLPHVECVSLLGRIQSRLIVEIGRVQLHERHATLRLRTDATAGNSPSPQNLTNRFLALLPELRSALEQDVQAAYEGDPAARSHEEIMLCYPGIEAVAIYRIAHELHRLGIGYLPRMLTEWAHRETGIDIHPGATIGSHFFIDHGTGVVIGETCQIGRGVTLYQGVTLGAWSFPRDEQGSLIRGTKRHPTLEDNVTVYSNATILGGNTIIGAGSQIGSSVTLGQSVPANTIVTIEKPSLRFREAA